MSGHCQPHNDTVHLDSTYGLTYRGLAADAQRQRISNIVGKLLRMDAQQADAILSRPPVHLATMANPQRVRKHQLGLANLGCITSLEHYWCYRDWLLSDTLKHSYEPSLAATPSTAFALLRLQPAPGHIHLQQVLDSNRQLSDAQVLNHADILLHSPTEHGDRLRQAVASLQQALQKQYPDSPCQVALGLFPQDGEQLTDLLDCLDERLYTQTPRDNEKALSAVFGEPYWLAGRAWRDWISLSTGPHSAAQLSAPAKTEQQQHWPVLWQNSQADRPAQSADNILQRWSYAAPEREARLQVLLLHCERLNQLPSLPTMAMKIYRLAQTSDDSSHELSRLVEQDPSLSARILALVNSSWFGLRARVESIEHALVVIGREELAHLALMISSEKVFRGLKSDAAEALWRHSSHVAEIARALARRIHSSHGSTLFTAGLLHDVGKILLLSFEAPHMQKIQQSAQQHGLPEFEMERELWGHDHARLGALMLRNWGLPDNLCRIVDQHHGPRSGENQISLDAALIALADHLAHRLDGSESHGDELRLRQCHLQPLQTQFGTLTTESLDLLCEDMRETLRGPVI